MSLPIEETIADLGKSDKPLLSSSLRYSPCNALSSPLKDQGRLAPPGGFRREKGYHGTRSDRTHRRRRLRAHVLQSHHRLAQGGAPSVHLRGYPHARQVADILFGAHGRPRFKHVVAVQYPRRGIYTVGFLTGDGLRDLAQSAGQDFVTVFIPTSPTPLTGFVIIVPRHEVKSLNMSVEDAFLLCMTAGMVTAEQQRPLPSDQAVPNKGTHTSLGNRLKNAVVSGGKSHPTATQ